MAVADCTFAPDKKHPDDYCNLPNTFTFGRLAKDPCIVYTHTFYVKELFELIDGIDRRFVIITHNSDMNVDDSFVIPSNVVKWFAQNVNCSNEKIVAIPIGLENDRWFPEVRKKERMLEYMGTPQEYKNLVYMNFNLSTNFAERSACYNALKNKPWVTTNMGHNGSNFIAYLRNIISHKFVACPMGNGLDTHRVWETLYMGSIPIVLRNALSEYLYSFFPVCIVDSWDEVTEELLDAEYRTLKDIELFYDHTEMLQFPYWERLIRSV